MSRIAASSCVLHSTVALSVLGISVFAVSEAKAETVLAVTQITYDGLDRVQCSAVRMNSAVFGSLPASACSLGTQGSQGPDRITQNIYDANGNVAQVRSGVGTSVESATGTYAYSANGKKTDLIDAVGNHSQFVYDGFDRQTQWIFPSKTLPTAFNGSSPSTALATAGTPNTSDFEGYGYDPNNNRTSLQKRDGRTLTYTYDGLNRVKSKCVTTTACVAPNEATGRDVYYSYDLLGRQLSGAFDSVSGTAKITNTFDDLGRLTSSSSTMDGTARTMSSQYDAAGDRTLLTGNIANYSAPFSYDALGRMTAYVGEVQIGYENLGRRSSMSFGSSGTTSSVSYAYDALNRLTSLTHDLAGTAADQTLSFSYNPASQIAARTASNDSYAYNGLVSVNRGYTANGLNQYAAAGSASFTYDANGNLSSDGSNTFAYDAENRLVSVSGAHTAALSYDPAGRLWQVSTPSGKTRFIYDGDHDVIETDGSGNELRSFSWGPGADEPLVWWEGGAPKMLHADERGSVISAADSSGNVVVTNAYDEYGIPGSANSGRFQFTGQAWLSEIGFYYYKARMYSPTLGRFMQTDPVGYTGGVNLYEYAADDSINRSDPNGLDPGDPFDTVAEAAEDAIRFINPTSIKQNTEYGGDVRMNGGKYVASVPVSGHGDNVPIKILPGQTKAWYHTHGDYSRVGANGDPERSSKREDEYDSDNFSDNDRSITRKLGVPAYLGTPSGQIKAYVPPQAKSTSPKPQGNGTTQSPPQSSPSSPPPPLPPPSNLCHGTTQAPSC